MHILYYNWVPLFDPLRRGGGVRIYQESLVNKAIAEGHHVTYLSAGVRYNLLRPGLRVKHRKHLPSQNLREFEVVNSPVLSPSHHQFGREISREDETSYTNFLLDILRHEGPFDVIHFNNVEGLPFSLFQDRSRLPAKRVLLSLHNYHLLCQQVNLWREERESCEDYDQGRRCSHCVVAPSRLEILGASTFHDIVSAVTSEGSSTHAAAFRIYNRLKGLMRVLIKIRARRIRKNDIRNTKTGYDIDRLWAGSGKFRKHREGGIAIISSGVDTAIAVSSRVADIFGRFGSPREKLVTRYIATRFAEKFDLLAERLRGATPNEGSVLHLAYLGYARQDKGFFFLIEALDALPIETKKQLRLTFAASGVGAHRAWMERKLFQFNDCSILDGYTHNMLAEILSDVDLGVVPVIWEDCLPQVAYEFICHGVPIFASDLGGAQELVGPPGMIFKAGDKSDFADRLMCIVKNRNVLLEFWDNPKMPILSWAAHWDELLELYKDRAFEEISGEGDLCQKVL